MLFFDLLNPYPLRGLNFSSTLKTEYQETKYVSFGTSNDKKFAMTFRKVASDRLHCMTPMEYHTAFAA